MMMQPDAACARIRIKICGITRAEDAVAAARLGADAIGLVFYSGSPRTVTCEKAREIAAALPPFVAKVGLFVNTGPAAINEILQSVPLDVIQFHGDEEPADCALYSKPYIKAVRMHPDVNVRKEALRFAAASALLLDTYREDLHGGTGETFDWSRIPENLGKPLILAGGLNPANVADAVLRARPYAVDVSGGVETGKGIKDARKMAEFIREVKHAESRSSRSDAAV